MQRNVKGAQSAGHWDECTSFRHSPSIPTECECYSLVGDTCVRTYVCMFCTRAGGGVKRQVETQELHSVLWEQRYCISPDQT